jgi:hypothetical protein
MRKNQPDVVDSIASRFALMHPSSPSREGSVVPRPTRVRLARPWHDSGSRSYEQLAECPAVVGLSGACI